MIISHVFCILPNRSRVFESDLHNLFHIKGLQKPRFAVFCSILQIGDCRKLFNIKEIRKIDRKTNERLREGIVLGSKEQAILPLQVRNLPYPVYRLLHQ